MDIPNTIDVSNSNYQGELKDFASGKHRDAPGDSGGTESAGDS